MTHICVSKLTIIGSDHGLSPGRCQAIANAGILLIRTSGANFSEIVSKIHTFSFKKMHLKMAPILSRPQCVKTGRAAYKITSVPSRTRASSCVNTDIGIMIKNFMICNHCRWAIWRMHTHQVTGKRSITVVEDSWPDWTLCIAQFKKPTPSSWKWKCKHTAFECKSYLFWCILQQCSIFFTCVCPSVRPSVRPPPSLSAQ